MPGGVKKPGPPTISWVVGEYYTQSIPCVFFPCQCSHSGAHVPSQHPHSHSLQTFLVFKNKDDPRVVTLRPKSGSDLDFPQSLASISGPLYRMTREQHPNQTLDASLSLTERRQCFWHCFPVQIHLLLNLFPVPKDFSLSFYIAASIGVSSL